MSSLYPPSEFQVSPNCTWLVWMNHRSADGWPFPAASHLDGTHFREWSSDTKGRGEFVGEDEWVEWCVRNRAEASVRNLADQAQDRICVDGSQQAKALVVEQIRQEPQLLYVDSPTPGYVEIVAYRTQDYVQLRQSTELAIGNLPSPIEKHMMRLPNGVTLLSAHPSPRHDRILYHLYIERTNLLATLLHRLSPNVPDTPSKTESLWTSRTDGSDMRELGYILCDQAADRTTDGELAHIEWLPDGKQVSFLCRGTLYAMPTDAAK